MANYDKLPDHMRDAARMYIEEGIHPGGFLMSVLCNNLTESFGRADNTNKGAMLAWVTWLVWDIPHPAWGSEEKVLKWMAERYKEREVKSVTVD